MRIAIVAAYTKSHIMLRMELIEELSHAGHEVIACGGEPEDEWASEFAVHGAKYRQFSVSRTGTNPFQDLGTIRSLTRLFCEERPDIVLNYHPKGNIYGTIAASRAGVPHIYCLVAGLGSVIRGNQSSRLVRSILLAEYRFALKKAERVIFQNPDDSGLFMDAGIVTAEQVKYVNGSGVNLEKFPCSAPSNYKSFLFAGRLLKDKGIREYLAAAQKVKSDHPDARFMIIGDVDDNPTSLRIEDIRPLIDNGTVEFFGMQKEVLPFYKAAAVFVLPSYHEGTPRSALEALAVGRPVILTDAPGCREVVSHGENGLMVPVRDVDALCHAMEYFLDNPSEVELMGRRSRKIAEDKYDLRLVNETICNIMGV